jgi:hypothetical protein
VIQPEPDDEGRSADAAGRSVTFDQIVADWVADGSVPTWPNESGPVTVEAAEPATPVPPPAPVARRQAAEEEHFIPPDPPPLPHLGPPAIVGLTLLVLGVILAVTPQVAGLNETTGLPLGLLTLALGLGWLVLRSWPTDEADDDDNDGAVL